MRSNYKKLGDYIREVNVKNSDNNISYLLGVSNDKYFMPSIANINGTDLSKYKVIKTGQFAFGPVTSRNGDKISIALMESDEAIVSTSYTVFEIIDHDLLLPEYLILWFKRTEFDRYCRFMSHGSVREIFDWNMMCQVKLPIPSKQLQKAIVSTLKTIDDSIEKSNAIIDRLREFSRRLYSDTFKKYTYNNSTGKIHSNQNGEVTVLEEDDLPFDWKIVSLEDISSQIKSPVKAGKDIYDKRYVPIDFIPKTKLVLDNYLSGRNAKSSLISFEKGDILLGAMRVYFHRVSFASFEGITRLDCYEKVGHIGTT
jgi:type I restriction enzyme S subunit